MGYPTRRLSPSATRARALVRGLYGTIGGRGTWSAVRTSVRHWRPGRGNFFGALLAYGILMSVPNRNAEQQTTTPLPDLTGWNLVCGPFAHPGLPYGTTITWDGYPAPPVGCRIPLGGQAGFNDILLPTDRELLIGWLNDGLLPLRRAYVFLQYGRTDSPPLALRVRAEDRPLPVVTPLNPVVTAPPLTPVRPMPTPIWLTPLLPPRTWPQQGHRGYTVPLGTIDSPDRPRDPNIRRLQPTSGYVDVRSPPWEREIKVAPQVGAFFNLMSTYGSVNSIINAMFYALPSYARTGVSGQAGRNTAVLRNLDLIDFSAFAMNAATWWLGYKAAGMFFGGLVNNLTDDFGVHGFDLYRAWATGDYYYRGVTQSGNPRRWNPSSMQGQPLAPASGPHYSRYTRWDRARERALNDFQRSGGTARDRQRLWNRLRRIRRQRLSGG